MRYRTALNRCWAVVCVLWIAWCLYWPFYARRQDRRAIEAETSATYRLCLQQKGLTARQCAADREAYTRMDERLAWPPEQSPYQEFAGTNLRESLSFLAVLCLFPIVFGYVLVRAVLEAFLWFARVRPQDAAVHH